jgi:hypothetical protein
VPLYNAIIGRGHVMNAFMTGLENDRKLILDLCAWSGLAPSRIAADLGLAATTLTRQASGKADTRIGRRTLDALQEKFPNFPGFAKIRGSNADEVIVTLEGASLERPSENLPIFGTALGAAREIDGEAIEQTSLNRGEIMGYVKRPTILNSRPEAYCLYVQGSSMHPALPDGEMVAVSPREPLSIGDNVVVYLRPDHAMDDDGQSAGAVLVKELVRRSATYVELRQYSPPKDFRIEMSQIVRIDRVLTRREMLS